MAQFEKIPQGLKPKDFISRIFGTTQSRALLQNNSN
jgi:hypothetical protein